VSTADLNVPNLPPSTPFHWNHLRSTYKKALKNSTKL
jgi:hypothetical protein